jgi:hypothetical protein
LWGGQSGLVPFPGRDIVSGRARKKSDFLGLFGFSSYFQTYKFPLAYPGKRPQGLWFAAA